MMKIQKYKNALSEFYKETKKSVCVFSIKKQDGSFEPICIPLRVGAILESKNMGFIVLKKYNNNVQQ